MSDAPDAATPTSPTSPAAPTSPAGPASPASPAAPASPASPAGPAALAVAIAVSLLLIGALWRAAIAAPMTDFDGPWHLACGRLIVETGAVPRVDPFCFTSDGLDWINLNWLAQVVLYRVYQWRGFDGTLALAALVLAGTLACVVQAMRARGAAGALALAALPLLWVTVVASQSIRPQTATFALLALLALVLERPDPDLRFGWRRALVVLAALLVWSHLHGGFVFGFALIALDAVGSCLDARRAGLGWVPRRARLLAGTGVAGALGFALHPHGFDALVYALTYTRALGRQLSTVPELMPLDFTSSLGLTVLAYVVVAAAGLALSPARARARDVLIGVAFFALAVSIRRVAVPLVIVTLPAVAAAWTQVLTARPLARLARLEPLLSPAARALPAALPAGAAAWALLVVLGLYRPGLPAQVSAPPFDPGLSPVRAVQALQESGDPRARGRVFTLYSAGGLLGWALYPERQRVFIDGRGDLHARGRAYDDYYLIGTMGPGWKERLDAWRVDVVLLGARAPVLLELVERHGWVPLHDDGAFAIVVRPGAR